MFTFPIIIGYVYIGLIKNQGDTTLTNGILSPKLRMTPHIVRLRAPFIPRTNEIIKYFLQIVHKKFGWLQAFKSYFAKKIWQFFTASSFKNKGLFLEIS